MLPSQKTSPQWSRDPVSFGQIRVTPDKRGGWELRHRDDVARAPEELAALDDPEDSAQLALYDDAGVYRPLKSAPNLRRGWRLVAADARALRLALDLFDPARVGAWQAYCSGRLLTTPLRADTGTADGHVPELARNSPTSRPTRSWAGSAARTEDVCARSCGSAMPPETTPSTQLPPEKFAPALRSDRRRRTAGAGGVPLLCQEACNLLVAEARAVVKGERPAATEVLVDPVFTPDFCP